MSRMKATRIDWMVASLMFAGCAAGSATPTDLSAAECAAFGPAPRDYADRIIRNPHARSDFRKAHPCPATGKISGACPGWVVDHIVALKSGGSDHPCNMHWQTRDEAK